MDTLSVFFTNHMVIIYFFYGLAFFITGVVVWLEASRSPALPLARALPLLAAFGLVHGSHEWVEMFLLMVPGPLSLPIRVFRLLMLAASFLLLLEFGLRLLAIDNWRGVRLARWTILAIFAGGLVGVWVKWGAEFGAGIAAADVWCRYSLAVPGAVLAAVGLIRQSRHLVHRQAGVSRGLLIVGLAFLLYGIPGQVFAGASPLPPSTVVNSALFLKIMHFPVQLLRTAMASLVAFFTVRASRLFEMERQRQMAALNQARLEAQEQLAEEIGARDALRGELLQRVVWAQEEERRYIARELHDEAGQALAALSWGLATVQDELPDHLIETRERIWELRRLTDGVMTGLRQLTTRLQPAVLDELGLVAALITYADDCSARFPFMVTVDVRGQKRRLPPEIETTLYRIAQEAITNVAKHAQATRVSIQLDFGQEVTLSVSDNGVGMDVEAARSAAARRKGWGLVGIHERAELVGGHVDIRSSPGAGAEISVRVPIPQILIPTKEESYEPDQAVAG